MAKHAAIPAWSRTIGWRQGHILPEQAAAALELATGADALVMVVSHDCDLANANLDDEPYVEVIAGRRLQSSDPNLANLKSARTLHLTITCEGRTQCIELTAAGKQLVPKSALAAWRPDPRYRLDEDNFFTLRRWLAARYDRAAFPDQFERRMFRETDLAERINKVAKKEGVNRVVSGIYFEVSPREELDPAVPYDLTVVLVYTPGMDPLKNGDIAEEAGKAIDAHFRKRCLPDEASGTWKHIRLKEVIAYSEEGISVARMKRLQRWHLDHLSTRSPAESVKPFNPPG
jgi:hypothetical protein